MPSLQLDPWSELAQRTVRGLFDRDQQQDFIRYLKDIKQDVGDGFHGQVARGTMSFATFLRASWWTGKRLPEAWRGTPFTDTRFEFGHLILKEMKARYPKAAYLSLDPTGLPEVDVWEAWHEVRSLTYRPENNTFYEAWAARVMRYEMELGYADNDFEVLASNLPNGAALDGKYLAGKFESGTLRFSLALRCMCAFDSESLEPAVLHRDYLRASGLL
ncbi:hypothetical protein A9R05_21280 [Burkholderia sp. KK1]|nr:hypothetical protein A9R05_21280 [Burkholderia sp. KK1]